MSDQQPAERLPNQPTAAISPDRGGFISGVLLQALKWIAFILGLTIFIVTVVIITINQIQQRSIGGSAFQSISREYTAQPPILEWYSNLGEIRGSTADEITRTFLVVPYIGYDMGDRAVNNELIARNIQIKEIITFYFSSLTADQLSGVENQQRVKSELTRQINRIMSNGVIKDVAFDQYQILDF